VKTSYQNARGSLGASIDYGALIGGTVSGGIAAGSAAAQQQTAALIAYDAASAGAQDALAQFQHGIEMSEQEAMRRRALEQQQTIWEREARRTARAQEQALRDEQERIQRELEARARATAGTSFPVWGWAVVAAGALGLASVAVVSVVKR
jgi:hypothetical protein